MSGLLSPSPRQWKQYTLRRLLVSSRNHQSNEESRLERQNATLTIYPLYRPGLPIPHQTTLGIRPTIMLKIEDSTGTLLLQHEFAPSRQQAEFSPQKRSVCMTCRADSIWTRQFVAEFQQVRGFEEASRIFNRIILSAHTPSPPLGQPTVSSFTSVFDSAQYPAPLSSPIPSQHSPYFSSPPPSQSGRITGPPYHTPPYSLSQFSNSFRTIVQPTASKPFYDSPTPIASPTQTHPPPFAPRAATQTLPHQNQLQRLQHNWPHPFSTSSSPPSTPALTDFPYRSVGTALPAGSQSPLGFASDNGSYSHPQIESLPVMSRTVSTPLDHVRAMMPPPRPLPFSSAADSSPPTSQGRTEPIPPGISTPDVAAQVTMPGRILTNQRNSTMSLVQLTTMPTHPAQARAGPETQTRAGLGISVEKDAPLPFLNLATRETVSETVSNTEPESQKCDRCLEHRLVCRRTVNRLSCLHCFERRRKCSLVTHVPGSAITRDSISAARLTKIVTTTKVGALTLPAKEHEQARDQTRKVNAQQCVNICRTRASKASEARIHREVVINTRADQSKRNQIGKENARSSKFTTDSLVAIRQSTRNLGLPKTRSSALRKSTDRNPVSHAPKVAKFAATRRVLTKQPMSVLEGTAHPSLDTPVPMKIVPGCTKRKLEANWYPKGKRRDLKKAVCAPEEGLLGAQDAAKPTARSAAQPTGIVRIDLSDTDSGDLSLDGLAPRPSSPAILTRARIPEPCPTARPSGIAQDIPAHRPPNTALALSAIWGRMKLSGAARLRIARATVPEPTPLKDLEDPAIFEKRFEDWTRTARAGIEIEIAALQSAVT